MAVAGGKEAELDQAFAALADPTRRAILARLSEGDATVGQLAAPFDISLPAISRHLRVLESAKLIAQEREGKFRHCRLEREGLRAATEWLDFHFQFWSESFERLDQHLKTQAKRKEKRHGRRRR